MQRNCMELNSLMPRAMDGVDNQVTSKWLNSIHKEQVFGKDEEVKIEDLNDQ